MLYLVFKIFKYNERIDDKLYFYFYRADASIVDDGYVYNLTEFGQVCKNY